MNPVAVPVAEAADSLTGRPEVHLLRGLVERASPSGAETEAARWLCTQLAELGFRAHLDEVGNVIGELGDPAAPPVVLLGHLDTVAGEVPVRLEGSLLYGRGAVDAKGPLSTMVFAAARAGRRLGVRLVVIGAVDEERESVGAHHVVHHYRPRAVIIGEPSGVESVVIGYKGVLRFTVDVRRPSTHPSSDEPKAVEVAAELWQLIRRWAPRDPQVPLFDQLIPGLVRLNGDQRATQAVFSCRTPVGFDAPGFLGRIRAAIGTDVLTVQECTRAVRRPRTDPVARALTAAIRRHGGSPVTKVKLGTSDMNVVADHWPVPTATYGPGDSRLDHTDSEHIDLREYLRAIDVLADALTDIAAIAPPTEE
jgi:[amino group carrier protein]-lysine/ornithine hydrolase